MKYTVRLKLSVEHEYEVEADDEEGAFEAVCDLSNSGDVGYVDWGTEETEDMWIVKEESK